MTGTDFTVATGKELFDNLVEELRIASIEAPQHCENDGTLVTTGYTINGFACWAVIDKTHQIAIPCLLSREQLRDLIEECRNSIADLEKADTL